MQFFALLSIVGLAAASPLGFSPRDSTPLNAAASVDRWSGAGCTERVCNIAGSGDLYVGCNVIQDACQASVSLNYANKGCKVEIWADAKCQNKADTKVLSTAGQCTKTQSGVIKAISVKC